MSYVRITLFWIILIIAIAVPIAAAITSPLLAWREPVYIVGGLAGVIAITLLLVQPMLAGGYLPGLSTVLCRRIHRWVGGFLVLSVIIHVAGLWITSPPDVIDALLFVSPTPFSIWGVMAMWCVFATAILAGFRRRLKLRPQRWRFYHKTLAAVIVIGSVIHALLIEGTMEMFSKSVLCMLVIMTTLIVLSDLKPTS